MSTKSLRRCLLPLVFAIPVCSGFGQQSSTGTAQTRPLRLLNQPAGFVKLSERGFDSRVEDGWLSRGDQNFRIVTDPTAPISPSNVGEALFPPGYRGGRGPIDTYLPVSNVRSLYVSCWLKLSPSFQGAASVGINKLFHIWIGEKSVVVVSLQGRNQANLFPQMRLQNVRGGNRGVSFNISPSAMSAARLERGRWYQLELLLQLNTPGQSNGRVRWWIDGVPAGDDANIGFVRFGSPFTWSRVSWNPTWGAPRDVVPDPMYIWMDHIYVSGRE
jgi:hypothetical protein